MTEDASAACDRALSLHLADDAATARAGAALAGVLSPGDPVMLTGGLGAGKTALARAAIAARLARVGRREDIPSPTFTLVQVYDADCEIWHADLYRLSSTEEAVELGLEDAFDAAICFVEWPERLGGLRPARRLEIALTIEGAGRRLTAEAVGEGWEAALAALNST